MCMLLSYGACAQLYICVCMSVCIQHMRNKAFFQYMAYAVIFLLIMSLTSFFCYASGDLVEFPAFSVDIKETLNICHYNAEQTLFLNQKYSVVSLNKLEILLFIITFNVTNH